MTARMLVMAGLAALAPTTFAGSQADASFQARTAAFMPPTGPIIMTRTLVRILADGKQVVVTRRFAIRFTPEGDGFRLDGEQIAAEVIAPAALAGLAEIERKRLDKGLFPVRLDSQGMIRPASPTRDPAAKLEAVLQGQQMIAASAIPLEAKRERADTLNKVSNSAAGSAWPVFLFNPGSQERIERRKLALPSGNEGEVEVRITVQGLMANGLPLAVERVVTTRLSGTSRVTREVWTFATEPV